jgi:hypothetical protein
MVSPAPGPPFLVSARMVCELVCVRVIEPPSTLTVPVVSVPLMVPMPDAIVPSTLPRAFRSASGLKESGADELLVGPVLGGLRIRFGCGGQPAKRTRCDVERPDVNRDVIDGRLEHRFNRDLIWL